MAGGGILFCAFFESIDIKYTPASTCADNPSTDKPVVDVVSGVCTCAAQARVCTMPASAPKKTSLKNQIRSLKRMLNRDGLPDEVRNNLTQKLKKLQQRLKTKEKRQLGKEATEALRKIFLIERTKVKRRLQKLRKKLRACDKDDAAHSTLSEQVAEQQKIMDYVVNFPMRHQPYIPYLRESQLIPNWKDSRDRMMARIQRDIAKRETQSETVDGFVVDKRSSSENSETGAPTKRQKIAKEDEEQKPASVEASEPETAADIEKDDFFA